MKLKFLFVLVYLVTIVISPSRAQAQSPYEALWNKVEDYFDSRYGRNYILVSYNYQYQTWPDSSLDCPQAGQAYQQGVVEGYVWTVEINDGGAATYELHSNLDASQIILCTPIDRSRLVNYGSYQNGVYVIDYPNTWQITHPDDSETIISPSGLEYCGDVGMQVLARQSIGNANTMLDDAMRTAGLVQNVGVRMPASINNPAALSLLYEGPCDGAIVQYRASAFPDEEGGEGYLILQWAIPADYPSWSIVFAKMLDSFMLINGDDVTEATPIPSDIEPSRLLAGYPLAHLFAQDIYIGEFSELPGYSITIGSSRPRRGLKFSADGQYLAYIDANLTTGVERLDVVSRSFPRTTVSRNVAPYFNGAWSVSGSSLAYLEASGEPNEDGVQMLEVRSVVPTDAGNPQTLGSIPFLNNCERVSSAYEVDKLYWLETGVNGNSFTFEWLPDERFLYTPNCDGTGLAIWNPVDNSIETLSEDLTRATLTQDKSRLAAIDNSGTVFVLDLANGSQNALPLEFAADQVAWSQNGDKLYYSNLFAGENYLAEDSGLERRALNLLGQWPFESRLNTVTLLEYSLNNGATRTVWQGQGFAIGRVVMAPNRAGFIFSLIPSDRSYIMAFVQGGSEVDLRFTLPETQLYWVSGASNEVSLLAVSSQAAFAPAVPATE